MSDHKFRHIQSGAQGLAVSDRASRLSGHPHVWFESPHDAPGCSALATRTHQHRSTNDVLEARGQGSRFIQTGRRGITGVQIVLGGRDSIGPEHCGSAPRLSRMSGHMSGRIAGEITGDVSAICGGTPGGDFGICDLSVGTPGGDFGICGLSVGAPGKASGDTLAAKGPGLPRVEQMGRRGELRGP